MLRADMNTIVAFLKDHVTPVEHAIDHRGMLRGCLLMDAANFVTWGYSYVNLQRVGTFLGIDAYRSAALADGHMDYYDDAGTPAIPGALIHTT
jgi:hypothetical protein